jgi:hypothetical protein
VREERRFTKGGLARARHHIGRNASQFAEQRFPTRQRQGHQRRPGLNHFQAELPRHAIGKVGRAQFRDRRSARCQHQRRCGNNPVPNLYPEPAIGMRNLCDRLAQRERHLPGGALFQQHRYDLPGGTVTEQLAQCLFVPGDPVPIDQCHEIFRLVAPERTSGEMRIG